MAVTINASTSAGLVQTADTSGVLALQTAGTTAVTVDASQNVGIGVTPSAWGTANSERALQLTGGSLWSYSSFGLGLLNNAFYDSTGAYKYRNNGFATHYFISSNNGTHAWFTAPSGTAGNTISFTQAMALNTSGGLQALNTIGVGNATPSTSGAGITFPATQSASSDANTLDDYEEGTWTPVLTRTGSSYTFNGQGGVYTKIGNVVTVQFSCDITAIGTQGTGYNSISGFPFAPVVYAGAGRSTAALSFNSVLTSATAMYYASSWFFTDGTNALQTNFTTGSFSGSITYTV